MMNLAEIQPVEWAALPLAEFRAHLRLPEGFSETAIADDRLEQCLRAALSAAEARTGKALFARQFVWEFENTGRQARVAFPKAPIVSLDAVATILPNGEVRPDALSAFRVIADMQRPAILSRSGAWPLGGEGTTLRVTFSAGFSATWAGIPPDLREATLILAADCFDAPIGAGADHEGASPAVQRLLQRYRGLGLGRVGI